MPSASRCGPGRRSSRSSNGVQSWCNPAKASSISDSRPQACATRHPDARRNRYSSRAVLPEPATPRKTRAWLWPDRVPATSRSRTSHSRRRPRSPGPVTSPSNAEGVSGGYQRVHVSLSLPKVLLLPGRRPDGRVPAPRMPMEPSPHLFGASPSLQRGCPEGTTLGFPYCPSAGSPSCVSWCRCPFWWWMTTSPFREAAAELLSARGFEVAGYAGNEDQAIVAVQQLRPDAVLLDIRLPGPDGFQVARRLSSGDDAPAVLLTSSDPDIADQPLAIRCGAVGLRGQSRPGEHRPRALFRCLTWAAAAEPLGAVGVVLGVEVDQDGQYTAMVLRRGGEL